MSSRSAPRHHPAFSALAASESSCSPPPPEPLYASVPTEVSLCLYLRRRRGGGGVASASGSPDALSADLLDRASSAARLLETGLPWRGPGCPAAVAGSKGAAGLRITASFLRGTEGGW